MNESDFQSHSSCFNAIFLFDSVCICISLKSHAIKFPQMDSTNIVNIRLITCFQLAFEYLNKRWDFMVAWCTQFDVCILILTVFEFFVLSIE